MTPLALLHALLAFWLAVYGLNSFILTLLYLRHRKESEPTPAADVFPSVLVQIPVYNELHVVERVIDHVAALDYPPDRLHIQVLDDSTDETTALAAARVMYHRRRGVDIVLLHRDRREGFKAGALAMGLERAAGVGELVAVFDADFCPQRDFLRRTVPHFLHRPRLGMVQARWGYLNADYSPVTRAQALALDGHFAVEQVARSRSGLPINFNGSAGIWRRECIVAAGGWQTDTLCEDLDLSYRAQLTGWECLYLPQVEVPTEIPPQVLAFKRQQARWAQGSVQTLRKLAGPLVRSKRLGWTQKGAGLIHLSSYLAHPLMVLLLLVTLPVVALPGGPLPLGPPGVVLGLTCLGPPLLYAAAQQALYPDWLRRLRAFPLLVMVGIGIAWSNTRAVWRGLTRWGGSFARTPKFHLDGRAGRWTDSRYRLRADEGVGGEIALAVYALVAAWAASITGNGGMVPFLLLYAAAFGTVAGLGLARR